MANFIKDQIVFRGEGKYRLVRVQGDIAQLENIATGEFSDHNEADLLEEYVRGYLRTAAGGQYQRPPVRNASIDAKHAAASSAAQGDFETRRRVNYLIALDRVDAFEGSRCSLREAIQKVATDLNDIRPPHATTVYRWRAQHKLAHFDVRALFDQSIRRGGKGQVRIDRTVEGIVQEKIETVFLSSRRGIAEDVFNAVFLEVQRLNTTRIESEWLTTPALRTIQRRIKSINAFERVAARYGEREAQRRFADQFCARRVARILEIVEIDHTPIDLIYTDANGQAIDRPIFTVVLDRFSRCVLGFCISSAGYGVHAVFEALRHSMMPKSYLRERFPELSVEWPCHGWPERLLMDNGREFHAGSVVDAMINLGIICEYAASREPNDKPHVERFIKTFNYSFIHKLPGTTLAKIHQRVGFKSEDEACLTFDKLNEMIHVWITSVYHLRPHRGLNGRAPIDVWKESASACPPVLKCNADDLSIEFGEFAECALQHYGIDFHAFKYVSTELLALRRMLPPKQKVQIKAPYENAGFIWVWDPTDCKYIRAENTDERYHNLTVEQAKVARLEYAKSDPHRRTRANGEEMIRDMASEAMRSKKLKTRRQGARRGHTTSKSVNRSEPSGIAKPVIVSPVTFSCDSDELPDFEVESINDEVRREN
ncbi:integrase [Burkholderia gladioli]|uniref:integrase n=1 Tax=Burkholderia gladioli TaxID=28095 RepID=UPI003B505AB7